MEDLCKDVRDIILEKKRIAENMRLCLYNDRVGICCYMVRNMSDPPWYLRIWFATQETRDYDPTREMPYRPPDFEDPLLVRSEQTLRCMLRARVVDDAVGIVRENRGDNNIIMVYNQGTEARPLFEDLLAMDDRPDVMEMRAWVQKSYCHRIYFCDYEMDDDGEDETKVIIMDKLMDSVRALIGEF